MNTAPQPVEAERRFVEALRPRFEREGYVFRSYPARGDLPAFMGRYEPDAIALKVDQNVAIEVKTRGGAAADPGLRTIRHLFEGRPDWQFRVFYIDGAGQDGPAIPVGTPELIAARIAAARDLLAQGQAQAAFLLSWSLFEAAARLVDDDLRGRPQSPGTIVQALAMRGVIDPDGERRIRGLIDLRNRVAHGDLGADPTADDVDAILRAAEAVTAS